MIVIVCGGRHYDDRAWAFGALDYIHRRKPITQVVQGGATGADALAKEWALERGIRWAEEPVSQAEWDKFGAGAGPMRNKRMLDLFGPQACIALPGGDGTADMVKQARRREVKVYEVSGRPPRVVK